MEPPHEPAKVQPVDLTTLISRHGAGLEIHQDAAPGSQRLTTAKAGVIRDNHNALPAGAPGPTLPEDFVQPAKIFHFDRMRIPERVFHARGYRAHASFTGTRALTEVTRAADFAEKGRVTPVFAVAFIRSLDSLTLWPAARNRVVDAFQHCKFIGWAESSKMALDALGLLRRAGDAVNRDVAMSAHTDRASVHGFARACMGLRYWPREARFQP